ncbi:hypothetical protein [Nocardioides halotolerans]|uniref:hypothetical protein n=1 Tax=Nocardioides halotolerans TaxID=433660 RepID=UPI0004052A2C|nr:hypothetical protein [Nocardioides halotolerans]
MTSTAAAPGRGSHARSSSTRRTAALAVLLAVVFTAVAWLRLDGTTRGTGWADDRQFVQDGVEQGLWSSLFDPYAGYLHVVPRLVTQVVLWVAPFPDVVIGITLASCVVAGLVGALVFVCSGSVVDHLAARLVLAAITVLVPAAPIEVAGNAANLHWYFLWLAPWLLMAAPTRWLSGFALGVVALLAGLTEIQVAMFVPLVLVDARSRYRLPVVAGLLLGVAAQVVATVTSPRTEPYGRPPDLHDLVQAYPVHVVVPAWLPKFHGIRATAFDTWPMVVLACVPFVLIAGALVATTIVRLRRGRPSARRDLVVVAFCLVGAVVPFVIGYWLNHVAQPGTVTLHRLGKQAPLRYGLVSTMFLLATAVVGADRLPTRLPCRRLVVPALVVAVAVLCLAHFDVGRTYRSHGPAFKPGYERASASCRAGASFGAIYFAPKSHFWLLRLDCEDFRRVEGG